MRCVGSLILDHIYITIFAYHLHHHHLCNNVISIAHILIFISRESATQFLSTIPFLTTHKYFPILISVGLYLRPSDNIHKPRAQIAHSSLGVSRLCLSIRSSPLTAHSATYVHIIHNDNIHSIKIIIYHDNHNNTFNLHLIQTYIPI